MSEKLRAVTSTARLIAEGEVIADRFTLGELVGEGPFGQVYRAGDELTETKVALKVFEPDLLETPPDEEQFLEATGKARKLTQRNVVRVHDSGMSRGFPWVSMQYLEGLSLRKTLEMRERKGERFDLEEAEPLVSQVTMALQHIGRQSVVGDLKPSNIFFLPDLVKVTDGYVMSALPTEAFVRRLDDSRYLAPEIREAPGEADARADVYSLGVILGEMVFGPEYTPGTTEFADDFEQALDRLCHRATAEQPGERYDNLETLSEDVSTLVDTGHLLEHPGTGTAAGGRPEPPADPASGMTSDQMSTREYQRGDGPDPTPPDAPTEAPAASQSSASSAGEPTQRAQPESAASEQQEDRRSGTAPHRIALAGLAVVAAIGIIVGIVTGWGGGDGDGQQDVVSIPGGSDGGETASGATAKQSGDASSEALASAAQKMDAAVAGASGEADVRAGEAVDAASQQTASDEQTDGDDTASDEQTETASSKTSAEAEDPQTGASETGGKRAGSDSEEKAAGQPSGAKSGAGAEPERSAGDGECPAGMVEVGGDTAYCIDRYEYPGAGSKPMTNTTWFEAKSACEDQGKRLCTLREWRRACGSKYPWGGSWDATKCNTADKAGFGRSLRPTGEQESCRSYSGTYDMVGNAFEWTKDQKVAGGGFRSGPQTASCRYSSPKAPGSSSASIGFRCCADP
jgi:serine/threonine protein kinase